MFEEDFTHGASSRGASLRQELNLRALQFARSRNLKHELSDGAIPSIIFGEDPEGGHGNFHPLSYEAICGKIESSKRLRKVHTAWRRVRVRSDWQWRELDCACSSDALLMNILCHPDAAGSAAIRTLLGVRPDAAPEFGYKPGTPLCSDRKDNSEMDVKLDDLLIEAKLTESDFQIADARLLHRYRDFEVVFDPLQLPIHDGKYLGYQLIRGCLAAYAHKASFCVFCDARRPDLMERWFSIMQAVRVCELRQKLKVMTWQELAMTTTADLKQFLYVKYGIVAAL